MEYKEVKWDTGRDFTGLMKSEGLSDDEIFVNCSYKKVDFQRVERRLVEKIETARINYVPFAHIFIEGIFSDNVYECVLHHLAKNTDNKYTPMKNWPGRNFIPLID